MKNKNIHLVLQDEKNKDEIIYNNIISSMTKDEQVKYLKYKVFDLETELKNRMSYTLVFLFAFVSLCFGIILLTFDLYILGILLIFATFLFIIIKLMITIHLYKKNLQNHEFIKIEELKKQIEKKLK